MLPATSLDKAIASELETLSPEELIACARVLALSVAEHRVKFGVVPLRGGTEIVWKGLPKEARGLPREARSALAEAMQIVRKYAAEQRKAAATAVPDPVNVREKRRQLRISITAPVEVAHPDGTWRHRGTMRNISWGGAGVRVPDIVLNSGDRVRVFLTAARGSKIPILATVLRVDESDGGIEYGVRFDSLSPEDEHRLLQVLEILMDSPQTDSRRSQARLVRRLKTFQAMA